MDVPPVDDPKRFFIVFILAWPKIDLTVLNNFSEIGCGLYWFQNMYNFAWKSVAQNEAVSEINKTQCIYFDAERLSSLFDNNNK